ncbi:MAG: T9SS type A sorting domain-containing protein [Saprospiraceae bacterium]|nr:T9SS type A sorting domain-containing protein [Saprospiraceae bacterium]MCF8252548.1 T9SS type A sorting domain-containing protein [Saprospiraceae bacterium]MCF8282589.1 T9SS type A sorting domain-containing protein [Bacteroidales bacterium]MCF8310795.1 T9SS type A sorting domain-containing protein [Saprospiraceae bacterium]MCF8439375.1 T9SS type A sorting domain-containing protein [Saprospiraceae bacterium]
MKKFIALSPLFLCSFLAWGQADWVFENYFGQDNISEIIRLKNQQLVMLHYNDYADVLNVLNDKGINLFQRYANSNFPEFPEVYSFHSLFETPDSTFAITTGNVGYDPSTMMAYEYFAILQFYPDFGATQVGVPPGNLGAAFSDGSYALESINFASIIRQDIFSSLIWSLTLNDYDFNDLLVTNSDSVLLATQQGLLFISPSGSVSDEFPNYVFERIKQNEQGITLAIKGDSAFVISSSFQLLAQTKVADGPIKDFDIKADTIALLSSMDSVHLMNIELNSINSFLLPNDAQFKFIMLGEGRLELAGNERYGDPIGNNATFASFVKSYTYDGSDFGMSNDVGVENIEQSGNINTVPYGTGYKVVFETVSVTIKNHGVNTIDTLYLRATQGKSKRFDNLHLLPGTSAVLSWPNLEQIFLSNPDGQHIDLCIWTSHPDFRLDLDATNDTYCTDFLVSDKEVAAQNNITIYPNPASDIINIQLEVQQPVGNIAFRILDVNGKVVRESISTQMASSYSIPVSDWATGIYFLQLLENGAVMEARKFVVIR